MMYNVDLSVSTEQRETMKETEALAPAGIYEGWTIIQVRGRND
jgi:hypothetical protein